MKAALLIILFALLFIAGCESLDAYLLQNPGAQDQAEALIGAGGVAAAPATGGASIPISAIAVTVASAVVAVNRQWVLMKRERALRAIDANPDTPSAASQVADPELRGATIKVTGTA